ncbi:Piwi domain-containing protein [Halopenitus sp. H-Gu1]|uniref:Piwi domain-containing protein n=1 Tax=Halopenitus sp. H-Gu1 TaxID=3242697 RepID=UPI00359E4206
MSPGSASVGVDRQADIESGTYLLHGYGTNRLEEIQVTQYDLRVAGGVENHWDRDSFTSSAAYYFDRQHGSPVASSGELSVISKTELSRPVYVWGRKVKPVNPTKVTLNAEDPEDREKLKGFVQSCFKRAIPNERYTFQFLNEIVRDEPAFAGDEFAAHPKHDIKIQVTAGGRVLVHVESGFSIRSTSTLDELYSSGDNPYGKRVAHDPERYYNQGQGYLRGWSEYHYTDHISGAGSSIAEMHEGSVDEEWRQRLIEEDPKLLDVKYGDNVRRQAPHFLRLSPRTEQVKDLEIGFYKRFDRRSAMMPGERYELSTEFLGELSRLPVLEMDFEPGPRNAPYQFLQMRDVDRLVFGSERPARSPGKGLRNHGVYGSPSRYRVGVLIPEQWEESFGELTGLVARGLKEIGAPAGVTGYNYVLGDVSNYTPVVHDVHDETDAVIAIVPDKGASEEFGIDDPHKELKRTLLRKGVPTQMMQRSTVDELVGQRASIGNDKMLNVLSAVVAKAGGTPWQIDSLPGETDAFMGLDVTYDSSSGQHSGASASVVFSDGTTFAAESTTQQGGEKFAPRHVEQFVRDLVFDFAAEQGYEIDRLCIMRDGKISEDIDAVRDGLTEVDAEVDIVGVRKTGQPRIAYFDGTRFRIAEKGVGFVDDARSQAIVHAFGKPEIRDDNPVGTPRTFRLTKDSGPTDIVTLTRQAYWLSEIHYGSPVRSPRLPVPIKYADMAAEYVRKEFVSPGTVIKGPAYL